MPATPATSTSGHTAGLPILNSRFHFLRTELGYRDDTRANPNASSAFSTVEIR